MSKNLDKKSLKISKKMSEIYKVHKSVHAGYDGKCT